MKMLVSLLQRRRGEASTLASNYFEYSGVQSQQALSVRDKLDFRQSIRPCMSSLEKDQWMETNSKVL